MSFWERTVNSQQSLMQNPLTDEVVLDEEAMSHLQEDPNVDLFEEEEEDLASLMSDANLRLEQGRLYQMVLQNDIFADTNADPRAIKNVQREIRNHAKERLETLLGIRQERPAQQTIVSSPFNDMEVTALKMVASKVTKGATEQQEVPVALAQPKKDGINSISGNLRANPTPVVAKPKQNIAKPFQKTNVKPAKSAIKEDESNLQKPIEDMTPEELAAHDAAAIERRSKNYAAKPNNMVPHPSPQALEMMYTQQVSSNPAPGSAVARMTDLINGRNN